MWEFLNRSRIAAAGCEILIFSFGPCDPAELDAFMPNSHHAGVELDFFCYHPFGTRAFCGRDRFLRRSSLPEPQLRLATAIGPLGHFNLAHPKL
jgi:hypothetical protein